jgi:hypothetical protein
LDGKQDSLASRDSIIQKGDVIQSVNEVDLGCEMDVKHAVAVVRRKLNESGEVRLRVLASRVYDSEFDMGAAGFTDTEVYLSNGYDGAIHQADDTAWKRFDTTVRILGWSKPLAYAVATFRLLVSGLQVL